MMMNETLQHEIIERLKPIHPEKVILFGSYAYGEPNKDSDIDLLVVTQDDVIPQSFKEKTAMYLRVARMIRDIEEKMPIDLIVHTKKMHEKFLALNSMFCRKIVRDGVILYENADRGMAANCTTCSIYTLKNWQREG